MPTIRVSNVISYYTEKQTHFEVSGATALEAVQMAGGRDPENGQQSGSKFPGFEPLLYG